MAYMSQENKKSKAPKIKALLKEYGIKGSLAVRNYSTLVLNLKGGTIDFIGEYNKQVDAQNSRVGQYRAEGYMDVNTYWYMEHFTGEAKEFFGKVLEIMNDGNHDNSDAQVDYFDVGWYSNINVGKWNKPYEYVAPILEHDNE